MAGIVLRVCDRCEAAQYWHVRVWAEQGRCGLDQWAVCLEDAHPGKMKPHRPGRKAQAFQIVDLPDDPM